MCKKALDLFNTPFYISRKHCGAQLDAFPARFYTDGTPQAACTLMALGKTEEEIYTWKEELHFVPARMIGPCIIIGSADFINNKVQRDLGLPIQCGVPLLSFTMYDVFDNGKPPFLHCIGNTRLCPDAIWWANSA